MLLLTPNEIRNQFGASYPTGGARRFNSDAAATLHRSPTHIFEFGYFAGNNFYAIVQKRTGGFSAVERDAILASYTKAKGKWGPFDPAKPAAANGEKTEEGGAEDNKAATVAVVAANGGYPLSFKFTPAENETNFPTPVFASHQPQGRQVVVWPSEMPDQSGADRRKSPRVLIV